MRIRNEIRQEEDEVRFDLAKITFDPLTHNHPENVAHAHAHTPILVVSDEKRICHATTRTLNQFDSR